VEDTKFWQGTVGEVNISKVGIKARVDAYTPIKTLPVEETSQKNRHGHAAVASW